MDRSGGTRQDARLGARWRLWSEVGLRGAGFAAKRIDELADPVLAEAADQLNSAATDQAALEAQYRGQYAVHLSTSRASLRHIASDPRFQTAVALQNRLALKDAVLPMASDSPGRRNRTDRKREVLIANYWQRYCLKNESVGFFGPIGWARVDASGPSSWSAGPPGNLVEDERVYFEQWAIDRLAQVVAEIPGVRTAIAPRRLGYVGVGHDHVVLPSRPIIPTSPAMTALLLGCDGARSARALAIEATRSGGFADAAAVYAALEECVIRRWITWRLEVPVSLHPERWLLDWIDAYLVGPEHVAAHRVVDPLVEGAQSIQGGGRTPESLIERLETIEQSFERIAGASATRREGAAYGGRTLLFSESRRTGQAILGSDFVQMLQPLSLVLDSLRWVTYRTRVALLPKLREIHARLAGRDGNVSLASFWFESMPIIHGSAGSIVSEIAEDLTDRWAEILELDGGESRVLRNSAGIRDRVAKAFAAPRSGWSDARWCCPDVMIAASGLHQVRSQKALAVLGEVHAAINTLRYPAWVAAHPEPARLWAELERDFPEPRIVSILPKDSPPRLTPRGHSALSRVRDVHLSHLHQTVDLSQFEVVWSADAAVLEDDIGELVVVTPGGRRFDMFDVFADGLGEFVIGSFSLFDAVPHSPRVQIDRLVVHRETWSFSVRELGPLSTPDEAGSFLAARSLRQRHHLPRRVFAKVEGELKPFYVDFDSPLSVRLLARAIRALKRSSQPDGAVRISELLPSLDNLWLTDGEGARYTSEFRLVAVADS